MAEYWVDLTRYNVAEERFSIDPRAAVEKDTSFYQDVLNGQKKTVFLYVKYKISIDTFDNNKGIGKDIEEIYYTSKMNPNGNVLDSLSQWGGLCERGSESNPKEVLLIAPDINTIVVNEAYYSNTKDKAAGVSCSFFDDRASTNGFFPLVESRQASYDLAYKSLFGEKTTTSSLFLKSGRVLDYIPESDVAAGTPVKLGAYVGVTNHAVSAGELGGLELDGIYSLPVSSGASFAIGDLVCFNDNGEASTTGTKFGYVVGLEGTRNVIAKLEPTLNAKG